MQRVIQSAPAAAILLGTAATTRAESVMKQWGEQWQSAKSAGTTNGATWPQFLAQCRAQLGSGAAKPFPRQLPPSLILAPSFRGSYGEEEQSRGAEAAQADHEEVRPAAQHRH